MVNCRVKDNKGTMCTGNTKTNYRDSSSPYRSRMGSCRWLGGNQVRRLGLPLCFFVILTKQALFQFLLREVVDAIG